MNLGEKIKKRRIELGLSQEELAKKVGYSSRSTINKIELGQRGFSQKYLVAFSKALNVPVEWLVVKLDDDEDDLIKSFGYLNPLEELDEDISAINTFLASFGEKIIKVNGDYFLGECGMLDNSEIQYLKDSAMTALKVAYDFIKKKRQS